MIKAYYHGFEVKRVYEYRADGTVRIEQACNYTPGITINVDPEEIELREE